jgi:hypothetical protein
VGEWVVREEGEEKEKECQERPLKSVNPVGYH